VFFDAASGAVTCTMSGTLACKTLTCTGFTGTLTGSPTITVSGSITFAAGMTVSTTANWAIDATATITPNGKSMGSNVDFNASGGTITLAGAFSCSGLRLLAGTLTTANNAITATGSFQVSAATTFNMGSSTVTTPDFAELGATTISAGTSTITGLGSFSSTGKTWNAVTFASGGTLGGTATISALTFPAAGTGVSTISLGGTYTITTLVLSGASATSRYFIYSDTPGTRRTITATTWTTVSDIDFRDIGLTNAKSPTRGGDCGNNNNITFPAAKTVYWNLAGAQNWSATGWATSSGGAPAVNNFPLAQDTAVFDNTGSVTGTITMNSTWNIGTLNMSARTSAMTLSVTSSPAIYASWTNGSGTTLSGSGALRFNGITTQTITSSGKTFSMPISSTGINNTITLADALTTSGSFVLSADTNVTLSNNTLTCLSYQDTSATARTLSFGTGNITVTGSGATAVNITSIGLTVTGTPVINMTYNAGVATTIATAGLSEASSISFNITAGSYALTFSGNGSARNLNFTGFSGSLLTDSGLLLYGNLTLSSGMTFSTGNGFFLSATSGTKTVTSNGKAISQVLYVYGAGGTWQLQDALSATSASGLIFVNGTLDLNGQTATTPTLSTQAGTKNLTFNGGTLVVTSSGAAAFNNAVPTGFTTTAGTGTGTIRMSSATAKTFVGGGSTFNCTLDQGGAGALTITGANTFSNITNSYGATGATSILFTAGTTNTFTDWNASGTAAKLLTIGSVTAATHTLSKASGTVSANYLSVSQSTATGGATWYAGANSTNGGNNTGWLFSSAPNGNFFLFF
jgi:hypothetical protein